MHPRNLRKKILAHYQANRRDLPWRRDQVPYRVWVSEIMLQQTQVATVVPRYEPFLERFPNVYRLAEADEDEVAEAWAGLGYYRRAKSLHAAARCIVKSHGGKLPNTHDELAALPGVGVYTAGAIASIAFGRQVPAVDGNVGRVLARVFGVEASLVSTEGRRRITALATTLVQGPAPGDLNQALMDLGSTVCIPRRPRCEVCPLRSGCVAYRSGAPTDYPSRPFKRGPRPELSVALLWRPVRSRGAWLERRSSEGLWAGQWQLPCELGRDCRSKLQSRFATHLGRPLVRVRHELTHRVVIARVYAFEGSKRWRSTNRLRPFADLHEAPLSGLGRRAIRAVIEKRNDD